MTNGSHLYEAVISNSRVWLKVQASCRSLEQSVAFFEARFNGTRYLIPADEGRLVTPFRLSETSEQIANWDAVVDRLPAGWDDDKYRLDGKPYAWCETLADGCDCHGSRGRLDVVYCADFGLPDDAGRRAAKSKNIRHRGAIEQLEKIIAEDDQRRRSKERSEARGQSQSDFHLIKPDPEGGLRGSPEHLKKIAVGAVKPLAARGLYCSIHKRRHAYVEDVISKVVSCVVSALQQMSGWGESMPRSGTGQIGNMAAHWLESFQSHDCAQKFMWGDAEVPSVLYKYIPRNLIGRGPPRSLRATQLLALNDIMECNVVTMGSRDQDTLAFLRMVQGKLKENLGLDVPWYELLVEARLHGSPRLSSFIQQYLNDQVGVVSLSKNPLVPTMWAHYAGNTGVVVGYDTQALRSLGYELRPMVYSEIAPVYEPLKDETIRLGFVDRDEVDRDMKAGRKREGTPLQTQVDLAEMGEEWQSLSRLLLVKGTSWEYEEEVRLLVELDKARDTGKKDNYGWPIKLIDLPPEAIREIWRLDNTKESDVQETIRAARGENKKGLLVQRVSSHAFRMQKTIGSRY